jgi:hypothetical protein
MAIQNYEEMARNTEHFGDSNEVAYDLIFEEMIAKQDMNKIIANILKEIELDLNCVVWLDDKHHKLLSSILQNRFKRY